MTFHTGNYPFMSRRVSSVDMQKLRTVTGGGFIDLASYSKLEVVTEALTKRIRELKPYVLFDGKLLTFEATQFQAQLIQFHGELALYWSRFP